MKEYIVQAIAQETIDSFDAHNAPELVRCKDCAKSIDPCGGWDRRCRVYGVVRDDFFCADGKPKGGDHS